MHYELQGIKDLCNHVRTNTLNTIKELKNVQWQVSEMRSGTTDANGVVLSNKGSLIYLMHEDMKTSVQSIIEALESSVKALQEAVQAGVNPEKSLKRKHQEYKEAERAAKKRRRAQTTRGRATAERGRAQSNFDCSASLDGSQDELDRRTISGFHPRPDKDQANRFRTSFRSR